MAQDYDNMAKALFANYAHDISQFVLGTDDVEVLENLDTEQQLIIAQRTDTVARIRVDNHEAIFHLELQLRDSTRKPMWARNAAYHGYLMWKYEIPVYSNVIYFHPGSGRNDTGLYTQQWDGYEYRLRYKVIRLIEVEGEAVLEMQAPGLLPFTPLMKPPAGVDLEQWVQECVNATLEAPVDQTTQADLLYAISLFGSIVHNSTLFERGIPEELMRESQFYQREKERITRENTIENTIEYTIALLEIQFDTDAIEAITPALRNINDLQKLKQLHLAAAKAQDIEAFAQLIHE